MTADWNFESLNGDFNVERMFIEESFDNFVLKWKGNRKYLESFEKLKEALDELGMLENNFNRAKNEEYYYWLKQELDNNDKEIRRKFMNVEEFLIKQYNKILFFKIELSKIDQQKQDEFLKCNELKEYRNYLNEIFQNAKYLLTEPEEKILSLKQQGSCDMWVKMVESLLLGETRKIKTENGKESERTYPELLTIMTSKNKKIRNQARDAFEDILKKYEDVAEVELNAFLEDAKVSDELRGFVRPDESRIKGDLIDDDFIDSILSSVKENLDISSRYYSLLAKIIGQENIGYHERNVDISNKSKKYDYEEAIKILKKVFNSLDKEFLEIFEKTLEKNRIDSHPKKGKNGGAFCVHFRNIDPHFILLNYTNELLDVTTFAHEMGHLINHTLMSKENPLNYGNTKATAEVASVFMEDFIFEEILKDCNDEEKFQLLFKKVGGDIATIHRQISLYLFELEIHKKYREEGYLSKEKIGKIFITHMRNYMGNSVDMTNSNLWWIYWEHIRLKFYVYSYASGALISKTMQKEYRRNHSFMEKIKEFLATGKSKSPREIFEDMGIKINKEFFDKGILSIREDLTTVEELAKKLKKI